MPGGLSGESRSSQVDNINQEVEVDQGQTRHTAPLGVSFGVRSKLSCYLLLAVENTLSLTVGKITHGHKHQKELLGPPWWLATVACLSVTRRHF